METSTQYTNAAAAVLHDDNGQFAQERADTRSTHLQYNDRLADAITVTRDLMARRAGVADSIHSVYTSPSLGGTDGLAHCPQVTRSGRGSLYVGLLPHSPEDGIDVAVSGPWPVTQVVIIEPHNLAVVVTPMDVFLMHASELYGQLGEDGHASHA